MDDVYDEMDDYHGSKEVGLSSWMYSRGEQWKRSSCIPYAEIEKGPKIVEETLK